jgi:hypothetical protein
MRDSEAHRLSGTQLKELRLHSGLIPWFAMSLDLMFDLRV